MPSSFFFLCIYLSYRLTLSEKIKIIIIMTPFLNQIPLREKKKSKSKLIMQEIVGLKFIYTNFIKHK